MKTTLLLTLMLAFATVSFLPPAEAVKVYCIEGQRDCPPGQLVCVIYPTVVCVRDPCYTTSCWNARTDVLP